MNKLKQYLSIFLAGLCLFTQNVSAQTAPAPLSSGIVTSALQQIGVTTIYDPAYVGLAYPNGDIDRKRGVCSDVVIRAMRDAHQIDLQQLIHRDMKSNFSFYPTYWGLKTTDKNIDHRRVLNLNRFFTRKGISLPVSNKPADYLPGDLVSWDLAPNLPHIGVVANTLSSDGIPLIIHNIGRGAERSNILFAYKITGHFRPDLKNW